uniref:Small ribosomal subunit protein uS4c n=1 Tax=Monotropa uniflora TaxID=50148 RepID=A0A221SR13_MONUN|nr:ribosomal protein S4 [Monotropa uniflora]ASN78969.1 ribosomal protein S4 [Monotropa uniflora]
MSRYRGPKLKIIRRLGYLSGLTKKKIKFKYIHKKKINFNKKSKYNVRLKEKQKLRFYYGITERQLINYFLISKKSRGPTGQILLQLLEMRLDNIIFRLNMASTIPGARQLINHGHILVNGREINIPSYRCKPKDIITVRDDKKSKDLVRNFIKESSLKKIPKHLTLYPLQQKGLVNQIIDIKFISLKIKESLIVEYYSRQTKF